MRDKYLEQLKATGITKEMLFNISRSKNTSPITECVKVLSQLFPDMKSATKDRVALDFLGIHDMLYCEILILECNQYPQLVNKIGVVKEIVGTHMHGTWHKKYTVDYIKDKYSIIERDVSTPLM